MLAHSCCHSFGWLCKRGEKKTNVASDVYYYYNNNYYFFCNMAETASPGWKKTWDLHPPLRWNKWRTQNVVYIETKQDKTPEHGGGKKTKHHFLLSRSQNLQYTAFGFNCSIGWTLVSLAWKWEENGLECACICDFFFSLLKLLKKKMQQICFNTNRLYHISFSSDLKINSWRQK